MWLKYTENKGWGEGEGEGEGERENTEGVV